MAYVQTYTDIHTNFYTNTVNGECAFERTAMCTIDLADRARHAGSDVSDSWDLSWPCSVPNVASLLLKQVTRRLSVMRWMCGAWGMGRGIRREQ